MNAISPLPCQWDGEAFIPLNGRAADRMYTVGEVYRLVPHEERSEASHRAYFASINEAHANLPDEWSERLPTAEHLRKYALIKAGYADERSIVCASKAEAQRVAAFIKPIDGYAVVLVSEAVVKCFTAKSQSYRSMGKAEFQKSKDAVLNIIASLIGVTPAALSKADAA